jgi:hypothetical protein
MRVNFYRLGGYKQVRSSKSEATLKVKYEFANLAVRISVDLFPNQNPCLSEGQHMLSSPSVNSSSDSKVPLHQFNVMLFV